jgi:hypothetical protein
MRGEKVNVGLAVFLPDRIDLRMPEVRKLRALTGHSWNEIGQSYINHLTRSFDANASPDEMIRGIGFTSETFSFSEPGEIAVPSDPTAYEARIQKVMEAYVIRPKLSKAEKQLRINTEISKFLKARKVLAKKGQTIDDHRVIPKFVVAPDKDLVADFAYKNGIYRFVATVDMRGSGGGHAKACERGATLHFAKANFGDNSRLIAVYAVEPFLAPSRSSEIEILKDFSGGIAFNWLDTRSRQEFEDILVN